jgi:hypothetical protein
LFGKLLTLLILGAAVLATVGVARASHDYMFDVTGVVTTEDGAPLKDAEVTLEVNGPVFEAVMVVRTVKRSTDGTGRFVFAYISHKRSVKYTLTVRSEGFEPQTVSGSAPPTGHHTLRMKRAGD